MHTLIYMQIQQHYCECQSCRWTDERLAVIGWGRRAGRCDWLNAVRAGPSVKEAFVTEDGKSTAATDRPHVFIPRKRPTRQTSESLNGLPANNVKPASAVQLLEKKKQLRAERIVGRNSKPSSLCLFKGAVSDVSCLAKLCQTSWITQKVCVFQLLIWKSAEEHNFKTDFQIWSPSKHL